jgi:hypothetical protein
VFKAYRSGPYREAAPSDSESPRDGAVPVTPSAPATDRTIEGTGHGPPVGIPIDAPKFKVRGGSNGSRFIVEVAYLGTAPVKVLDFIVNGRAGSDSCDTSVHGDIRDWLPKLPREMQTGDAFTFTLYPSCGGALARIAIHTDRGDVTYEPREN